MPDNTTNSILYLTYDGLTDTLGQSQILPYLTGLAERGCAITVISFEKEDRYKAMATATKVFTDKHGINWIPLTYTKRPPVLSTIYDLVRLWKTIRGLMCKTQFSIVHCRSYLTAIIGQRMKRAFGTKFIFDMRGFWADERVEGGLWKPGNPVYATIYRFFKRKEKALLRDADHIVVLTEAARKVLDDWKVTQPVSVIPCCVDLDLFSPSRIDDVTRAGVRTRLGIRSDQYVLLYLGSLGTWYMLPEMVSYFEEARRHNPQAIFVILTPDLDKVPQRPDVVGLTVSRDEVPAFISISDACVCFIKPSFSKTGSSATKMAEILAMEVPVITNSGWGDVAFLERHIDGIKITDPYAPSFVQVASSPRSLWFDDFFSLSNGVERYFRIYKSLGV